MIEPVEAQYLHTRNVMKTAEISSIVSGADVNLKSRETM
jgi:hypothetical protein